MDGDRLKEVDEDVVLTFLTSLNVYLQALDGSAEFKQFSEQEW